MKLGEGQGHLTYCMNIHPTQTFDDVMAALNGPVAEVKEAVSPDAPFAVGLRFSGEAMEELADPDKRAALKSVLDAHDFRGITVNGFPYGQFHGTKVKEQVYQPDWRSETRVNYTNDLAELMAEIAPKGAFVSLSTVPGTFKTLAKGAEGLMADNYLRSVAYLVDLRDRTGTTVAVAIEPEPACFLETITETVDYFRAHLFSASAVEKVAAWTGLPTTEAAKAIPRHLGVCYDVCHAAVEYEDPAGSIAQLKDAGIPIHKLQLSAALRVAKVGPQARAAMADFDEPTYLHQVIRRTPDGLKSAIDLPEVLALDDETDGEEWRVHFHVPIYLDDLDALSSTRDFLEDILAIHKETPISRHLEIETYTWDVLPATARGDTVALDIAREMRWVMDQLQA